MELSDVFNQDVNKYATAALSELQAAQKNELANQYQSLQNDRYGQVTPYEVAQQRLAGLRADAMGDSDALRRYKEGTLGQFDTQAVAGRKAIALEPEALINERNKFSKEKHDFAVNQLNDGIDLADNLLSVGQTPQQVSERLTAIYGQLPDTITQILYAPNAKQLLGKFREHVALSSEKYLQQKALEDVKGGWHVQAAATRQKTDEDKLPPKTKAALAIVKQEAALAGTLLGKLEESIPPETSKMYKDWEARYNSTKQQYDNKIREQTELLYGGKQPVATEQKTIRFDANGNQIK